MKNLHIIICDCGDGSQSLSFTFDNTLVKEMEDRQCELGDSYQSGDGLQVTTLKVPNDSTYESLGISKWSVQTSPFEDEEEF